MALHIAYKIVTSLNVHQNKNKLRKGTPTRISFLLSEPLTAESKAGSKALDLAFFYKTSAKAAFVTIFTGFR